MSGYSHLLQSPKSNNSVRICGDCKSTVNPNLDCEQYPLPKAESLFVVMQGGEKFTKLDLKCAYSRIVFDEESRQILTLNTYKGLLRHTRLIYVKRMSYDSGQGG